MIKQSILFVIIGLCTTLFTNSTFSQSKSKNQRHSLSKDDRSMFYEASILTEEEVFYEAARVWKGLVDDYPDCGNYRYHYAVCLLNSGEPVSLIDKQLTNSISSSGSLISGSGEFNEGICYAPVDVLVYAAHVKLLLLEFDEALSLLDRFNNEAKKRNPLRRKADLLQSNIKTAKNLIASPIDVEVTNMGSLINSDFDDTHPVIRADEKQLFFSSHRARSNGSNHGYFDPNSKEHYADIYVADRDTSWKVAEWVNIGLTKHEYALAISPFGESLTVAHFDGWDEYIYRAIKSDGKWQKAVSFNVIADAPSEGVIVFSPDNSFAIMSIADRKGRSGLDLYQYNKLSDDSWSSPEKIDGPINSDENEISPFISADGTLFFASNCHTSMGGYDCYSSVFENGKWSDPVNLGYPINTVDDDSYFAISAEGTRAYIASRRNRPLNDYDIFEITFTEESQLVNSNIMLLNSLLEDDVDMVALTLLETGETTYIEVLEGDKNFKAILYGGQSYKIEYQKSGDVLIADEIEIATDAGYHLYTDTIDSNDGGISGDTILIVEKYIEPEQPELIEDPISEEIPVSEEVIISEEVLVSEEISVSQEGSISLEDSHQRFGMLDQVPEPGKWMIFYKLKPRIIHHSRLDISLMVDEVVRLINNDLHPKILVSSSAFRKEGTSFEEDYVFSGKRSSNIFLRMKSMLSDMGYIYKVDYTFFHFKIHVVTDTGIEVPDYVKIEITSRPK